jgi:hypothetical protein
MIPPFKVGDRVLFNPKAGSDDLGFFTLTIVGDGAEEQIWQVVHALSLENGARQYHIKAHEAGQERLATEDQLRPVL